MSRNQPATAAAAADDSPRAERSAVAHRPVSRPRTLIQLCSKLVFIDGPPVIASVAV